ncbi:helix-turn-helix transcriptional regulator [Actinoplanes sp. TBRC 11911]|uniref:helix-turn-helix transcriptional regulator n=1 Tax=Actinoplanes sp. TBRC 11911 TaxID=2729386 RepID=UPI0037BE6BB0
MRSRRAMVDPQEVGITSTRRRRVAGLRREELARLAKISVPYYTRLEQGKHTTASHAVLESLATALRLPPADRAYLHQLAEAGGAAGAPRVPETPVGPETLRLLDALDRVPGILLGPNMDILAVNPAARSFCQATTPEPVGLNAIRWQLFDPRARELFGDDWAAVTAELIGMLRLQAGRAPGHPAITRLVDELDRSSEFFRRVWAEHKVSVGIRRELRMRRPDGTATEMTVETLSVNFARDQTVLLFVPAVSADG